MNSSVFTLLFAILGLAFNRHVADASKHGMCSENPCHEDATCFPIGNDLFECKCNDHLIGDGISACNAPRVPKEVTRVLKGKKKKKKQVADPCGCSLTTTYNPAEGADNAVYDQCCDYLCNDVVGTLCGGGYRVTCINHCG
jgi:hypothetical protein